MIYVQPSLIWNNPWHTCGCSKAMTMSIATPLTRKLIDLMPLSAADVAVLDALQSPTLAVPRHREPISAGRRMTGY